MEVYMDEIFWKQFSMVKTSNFQKPFLAFDSWDSEEGHWPVYKNFQKFRKFILRSLTEISRKYFITRWKIETKFQSRGLILSLLTSQLAN